jgi:single-stranded-DNA-specific exonuclease
MSLGIECLVTDDPARAQAIARELDRLNRERREIEAQMQETALASIGVDTPDTHTLVLFEADWHQGVIGIVASRIKDRVHRPVIAFARGERGEVKGSGRSIRTLHLRDALDIVTKRHPGLVLKFGGHAAAAGLTLRERDLDAFRGAFEEVVRSLTSAADLQHCLETDGSLATSDATLQAARTLSQTVWGQGFPEPCFHDPFEVQAQRVIGGRHLKLKVARGGNVFDAMLFNASDPLPQHVEAVYRLDVNDFNNTQALQLTFQHWRPVIMA